MKRIGLVEEGPVEDHLGLEHPGLLDLGVGVKRGMTMVAGMPRRRA
ncbi:MAG: hypothetical protein U5R48_00955 [Gammaproteobacteria bacterium]|nr:hypothetical protein [Gammaproteobacteria bacterium]